MNFLPQICQNDIEISQKVSHEGISFFAYLKSTYQNLLYVQISRKNQ
jgi:hypothetical protein